MKSLFEKAAELPEAERSEFVLRACPDDEEIRREVERLLQFGAITEAYLDRPPVVGSILTELADGPRSCQPGELLANRFRIVRLVGRGGMGEVFEAFDEVLQQRIALKTIRPEIVHESKMEERFRREILLARQVTHPNVCRVYDFVKTDRIGFLTMEFLEGETLAQFLRERPRLSLDEARPLIEQMAAALAAAHRAGVVHRDFKSANVFLTKERDGSTRVVVTDFGLARSVTPAEAESETTMGAGTPAFMAPEQLDGRPVGPAADIYALGLVMYEMATGSLPYAGDSPLQVAVRRLREKPKPPRAVVPEVDSRWESVILRCLETEPEDRFAEAGSVVEGLSSRYSLPWIRVRKSWRLGTVAVVTVVGIGLGVMGGRWLWAPRPAPGAEAFYQQGVAALADGTFARAARMLELALEKDSNHIPIRLRLAEAYWRLDQPRKAQEQLLRAEERTIWHLDDRRLHHAVRALVLRDFPAAVQALEQRVGSPVAPPAPEPRLDLARALEAAESVKQAVATYEAVLQENPQHPAALLRLAAIADQRLQADRAGQFYRRATAEYGRRLNEEGLAATLVQQAMGLQFVSASDARQRLAEAERISEAALTPAMRSRLRLVRAVMEVLNGDSAAAEQWAKEGVAVARQAGLEAQAAAGLVDLGLAYLVQSKLETAREVYAEAGRLAESSGAIYWGKRARLGQAWAAALDTGRQSEAVAALREVEPFFESNGYQRDLLLCWRIRADALFSAQQLEEALKLYELTANKAQEVGEERTRRRARQLQGELLIQLGRFPAAVRVLQANLAEYQEEGADKQFPVHYYQCRLLLGRALGFQGRLEDSRNVLTALLEDRDMKSAQIQLQTRIALAATESEAGRGRPADALVAQALADAPEGPARDEARQQQCLRERQVPVCLAVKAELRAHKSFG
ncbi:MAG: protein kinase, partial [Hyphomonas sp.]|nr:protein kinase [Hyphomonas sp.]